MKLIKFNRKHLVDIKQDREIIDRLDPEQLDRLEASEHAHTIMDNDEVIACFGFNTGYAWIFMGESASKKIVGLYRTMLNYLNTWGPDVIKCTAETPAAKKWVKALGFKEVTPDHFVRYA